MTNSPLYTIRNWSNKLSLSGKQIQLTKNTEGSLPVSIKKAKSTIQINSYGCRPDKFGSLAWCIIRFRKRKNGFRSLSKEQNFCLIIVEIMMTNGIFQSQEKESRWLNHIAFFQIVSQPWPSLNFTQLLKMSFTKKLLWRLTCWLKKGGRTQKENGTKVQAEDSLKTFPFPW